jgi:hypothetical protein
LSKEKSFTGTMWESNNGGLNSPSDQQRQASWRLESLMRNDTITRTSTGDVDARLCTSSRRYAELVIFASLCQAALMHVQESQWLLDKAWVILCCGL